MRERQRERERERERQRERERERRERERDRKREKEALSRVVKAFLADEVVDTRHWQLYALPTQVKVASQWEAQFPELWM